MTVVNEAIAYLKSAFGQRVTRATGTLPATATGTLFTVAGGAVMITSIVGIVTTAIQAQVTAVKLVATPTVGAVNDLSATVDLNALAAGGLISAQGLAADALIKSTGGGISNLRNPILVNTGAIGLNTAATSTGSIRWILTYVPLEDGATVVAA
jgi:hypothetical protein